MTETDVEACVLAYGLLAAIDRNDWAAVTKCFAADGIYTPPVGPSLRGRESIEEYYTATRPIASGAHTVDDVIHRSGRIVVSGKFAGKTRGGAAVRFDFVDVMDVSARLIASRSVMVRDRTSSEAVAVSPILQSERLVLRPFHAIDARDVARIAGSRAIADTTISIPHPMTVEGARNWIATSLGVVTHHQHAFAITDAAASTVVGGIALRDIDREHGQAELSFWLDPAQWGRGYAREAAARIVIYAFADVGLHRLVAYHMVRNQASGHVLTRLGFIQEGLLRARVRKWGVLEDVCAYALLARIPPTAGRD